MAYTFNNLLAITIKPKEELETNDGNMRVIMRKSRAATQQRTLDVPFGQYIPAAGARKRVWEATDELPDFMRHAGEIRKRRPAQPITDLRNKAQTDSILVTDIEKYFDRQKDLYKPVEMSILQFKYPKTMGTNYSKEMKLRQSP